MTNKPIKREKRGVAADRKLKKSKKADEGKSKSSGTVKRSSAARSPDRKNVKTRPQAVKSAAKKSVKLKARKKVAKKAGPRKAKQITKKTRPLAVKTVAKKSVKLKARKKIAKQAGSRKTKQITKKTRRKVSKAEEGRQNLHLEKTIVPHVPRVEGVSEDQEAKFVLGPPEIIDESWKDSAWDIPDSYGDNRVTLMPRDPKWVFCYWEIGPEAQKECLRALGKNPGQTRWNLRVYGFALSAPGEMNFAGDLQIDFSTGKSYLELSPSGASFQVELGLMDEEGNFVAIAVSNRIDLPPDRPAETVDEQWVADEWFHKELYDSSPFEILKSGKSSRKGSRQSFGVSSFSQYARKKQ